jgi:hypothetical protein
MEGTAFVNPIVQDSDEVKKMNIFQQKREDIKKIIEELHNTIQKRQLLHNHIMNELEQDSNSITDLLYEVSETRKVSKDVLENELYQLQHEKRTEQRLYLQDIWSLRQELLEKETQLHELENKLHAIESLGEPLWTQ